jgi:hypothetical protein
MRGPSGRKGRWREAAAAIGAPSGGEPAEPLTSRTSSLELYAGSAYWFEDRRGLAIGLVVGSGWPAWGFVLGLAGSARSALRRLEPSTLAAAGSSAPQRAGRCP